MVYSLRYCRYGYVFSEEVTLGRKSPGVNRAKMRSDASGEETASSPFSVLNEVVMIVDCGEGN